MVPTARDRHSIRYPWNLLSRIRLRAGRPLAQITCVAVVPPRPQLSPGRDCGTEVEALADAHDIVERAYLGRLRWRRVLPLPYLVALTCDRQSTPVSCLDSRHVGWDTANRLSRVGYAAAPGFCCSAHSSL